MASGSFTEIAAGGTIAGGVGTIAGIAGSNATVTAVASTVATHVLGASSAAQLGSTIATIAGSTGPAAPFVFVICAILTKIAYDNEFGKNR
jgi:hypothetical protein